MEIDAYDTEGFWDELFQPDGKPQPGARILIDRLRSIPPEELARCKAAAETALLNLGITFNVYGGSDGQEKIFPFDIIPRVLDAADWAGLERGLEQRVRVLNLFIDDVYHEQRIIRDGVVPRELVETSGGFRKQCVGLDPPRGIWCHVDGSDLVRDDDGTFCVLEDNLRCPSGVSYVLENREILKRTLPGVFEASRVRPVADYASRLFDLLEWLGPTDATVVILTPGSYNSAYYEHSYLAHEMGVELVEGRDLIVERDRVFMRTTRGLRPVDVIYRRVDDDFLDPLAFRSDSMLGVPGLLDVYKKGGVALANAPGTGVADDKAIYAFVPAMVRYYLGEDAILPNVETFVCIDDAQRDHVLANIDSMVVKAVNESGGYGMLVGPAASRAEIDEFSRRIRDNPRNYIAQPTLRLSRAPVFVDSDRLEGRHVDLRPFVLCGESVYVQPGGLTRVALEKGSLVVNSSQGGGSKDTWVLR